MAGSSFGTFNQINLPARDTPEKHKDLSEILADAGITYAKYSAGETFQARDLTVLELAEEGEANPHYTGAVGKFWVAGPIFETRDQAVQMYDTVANGGRGRTARPGLRITWGTGGAIAKSGADEIDDLPGFVLDPSYEMTVEDLETYTGPAPAYLKIGSELVTAAAEWQMHQDGAGRSWGPPPGAVVKSSLFKVPAGGDVDATESLKEFYEAGAEHGAPLFVEDGTYWIAGHGAGGGGGVRPQISTGYKDVIIRHGPRALYNLGSAGALLDGTGIAFVMQDGAAAGLAEEDKPVALWQGGRINGQNVYNSNVVPNSGTHAIANPGGTSNVTDGLNFGFVDKANDLRTPGMRILTVREAQIYMGAHWSTAGGDSCLGTGGGHVMLVWLNKFWGARDLGAYCNGSIGSSIEISSNLFEGCFYGASAKREFELVRFLNNIGIRCMGVEGTATADIYRGSRAVISMGLTARECACPLGFSDASDVEVLGAKLIDNGAVLPDGSRIEVSQRRGIRLAGVRKARIQASVRGTNPNIQTGTTDYRAVQIEDHVLDDNVTRVRSESIDLDIVTEGISGGVEVFDGGAGELSPDRINLRLRTDQTADAAKVDLGGATNSTFEVYGADGSFARYTAHEGTATKTIGFDGSTMTLEGAAQADKDDTTEGKLLINGAHGLGSSAREAPNNDLNDCDVTGMYRVDSTGLNMPPGGSHWIVLHMKRTTGVMSQIAICRSSNSSLGRMAVRANAGGVWSTWSRVYSHQDILGNVSQSGGVPTGALIETGSNANGEYTRFADGTQICTNADAAVVTEPAAFTGTITKIDSDKLWIGRWF